MYWSYLLAAVGILGLWLVGKKLKSGFIVGIVAQLLWVAYGLITHQYGFLITAAAYSVINFINLRKWSKPEKDTTQVKEKEGYIHGLQAAAETINIYGEAGGLARIVRAINDEKVYLESLKE
jgi:nicotinamide riboside transporter PnuC